MTGTQSPLDISTRLQRIAELARRTPTALTTLAHHIDVEFLREAYRRTRKDGAVGVDGETAAAYAEKLDENLRNLLDRFKSGTYKAPPVRRVHIPKGDGTKTRPIGIPTFEDKLLQRAVTMVLEAVYEQVFLGCSYGFRPARSAHDALQALRDGLMEMNGGWVLEVDIQSFFDTLDHAHLRSFLDQRVQDGVLRRTINKWLKAGVLEGEILMHPDAGTPQGGVVSPLLANVYLHEVLDRWFETEVKPRLHGRAFLIRYADDAVLAFSSEDDARRVLDVLPKRFGRYGLVLHPDKTRLVPFGRPTAGEGPGGGSKPGSFDLLGFTHYWARSRRGYWVVKQKTASSRFGRALRRVGEWCRVHMHRKIADQHRRLVQMLRGHYGYFGITGNSRALSRFSYELRRVWRKWLDRRSRRTTMPWPRFERLLERYPLPPPVAVHSIYRSAAKP
ncbi:MAG TPA: group II intron reverse transcriptase/maturase [Candidatus Polarisedimenticolia bacterium]|nr:group II intron reverse transcriptase/maturase [Candidatus Polarisedimenticolia bacterium]